MNHLMVLQKNHDPEKKSFACLVLVLYVSKGLFMVCIDMQIPSPFKAYGLNWKHSGLSLLIFAFYLHF